MKSKVSLAVVALAAMFAYGGSASADEAMATANVNMRAGPDVYYPVITTIPRGAGVDIHGCLGEWEWCDVSWYGARGWVSSDYLATEYRYGQAPQRDYRWRRGVPVIQFSFNSYWDNHYRNRSWYRDRDRWRTHRSSRREDTSRDRDRDRDYDRDRDRDRDRSRTRTRDSGTQGDHPRAGRDDSTTSSQRQRSQQQDRARNRGENPRGGRDD
jgi:uncharacterized protein YraI